MHPSKRKGNGFEREIVRLARERGLEAERAYASNGRSLGCTDDVDLVIESWRIQAKRRKALPAYLKVPPGADATVFREDRGEPLALVPLGTLLGMIEAIERERARERQAHGMTAPGQTLGENFPKRPTGKTRDKAGEAVAIGRTIEAEREALEPLEKKAAAERRIEGNRAGGKGGYEVEEKFPSTPKGKTIDRVAAAVGMSGPEIQRGPTLFDQAP